MTRHPDGKDRDIGTREASGDDRLTMAEAARLKGVSYHTVSRAVRKGRLPVERLGRMALISARDLQEWHPMKERAPRKYRRPPLQGRPASSSLSLLSADHLDLARRLSALYDVIHSSASEGSLEELARLATERMADAFHLDRMVLWRIDIENNVAARLSVVREPLSTIPGTIRLDEVPFFMSFIEEPHARIVDGPRPTLEQYGDRGYDVPRGPLLIVPLVRKGQVVGVMLGDRDEAEIDITAEQLALADGIASQMAMAIDNAMLRETERQRRMQLEAILGELNVAVSAFDESGRLTLSNAAERDLFGLTEEEAKIGQSMQDYLNAEHREYPDGNLVAIEDNPARRALKGEKLQNIEQIVIRKDGERRFVSTNSRPILVDGRIIGAVSVSRDTTSQHVSDAREQLRLQQLELAARRSKALSDLVVDINSQPDAHAVVEIALQRIAQEIGAKSGVMLLRNEQGSFEPITSCGAKSYEILKDGVDLSGAPLTVRAFSQHQPVVVKARAMQLSGPWSEESGDDATVLIIPVQVRGQRIGVAYLTFENDPELTESDLTFSAIWGRQCAQAIDKVMLVDQLEFAHDRLMAIIDQLVQAVIILDASDGEIVISNQAAEALWGRRLDDDRVRAERLTIIDEEGYPLGGDDHPLLRPLRTQEPTIGEPLTVVRSDGAHVDVLASHSPLFDGRGTIIGSVSVLQDRADFKPLDRAKDEFISVVAHELRNPLTSLRGNLQLLQRRFRKRDDETVDQDVERIDSIITQVDRIADLVSRMLDVSRVDLGSLDVSVAETDAAMLVKSVVMEAHGLKSDRPIVLNGPESLPVVWDAARVQQVLGNLMQNAARYAPAGPVDVDLGQFDTDRVRITVRDHGPGVPSSIRKRLFKQYHRFDDGQDARTLAANGNHGLGIGLYISARLARAHGGSLTVDNAPDGGAIFTLELPRDASQAE